MGVANRLKPVRGRYVYSSFATTFEKCACKFHVATSGKTKCPRKIEINTRGARPSTRVYV